MKDENAKLLIKQQRLAIAAMRKTLLGKSPEEVDIDDVLRTLLSYGTSASTDIEALMRQLQLRFGSYSQILDAHMEDLMRVEGMTEYSATFIKLIASLAAYCAQTKLDYLTHLRTPVAMGTYCTSLFLNDTCETMYVIALDEHGKLLGKWTMGTGLVYGVSISTRDIVRRCLQSRASFAAISHNHPGGALWPSDQDIKLTKRVYDILRPFHVLLLDHIIVAKGKYISLLTRGDYKYTPLGDDLSVSYMLLADNPNMKGL